MMLNSTDTCVTINSEKPALGSRPRYILSLPGLTLNQCRLPGLTLNQCHQLVSCPKWQHWSECSSAFPDQGLKIPVPFFPSAGRTSPRQWSPGQLPAFPKAVSLSSSGRRMENRYMGTYNLGCPRMGVSRGWQFSTFLCP